MNSDVSGVLIVLLVLTAALAYGLSRFKWKFVWLYAYTATMLVLFVFLLSVSLPIRGLLYCTYPWFTPMLALLPTFAQQYSNALFKIKSEDFLNYVLLLLPMFTVVMSYGTVADSALYQKNLAHLFAWEFFEVKHVIGTMTSSLTYLTTFSTMHAVLLFKRVRIARLTGPSWLYWTLPSLQLILSASGLFAIIVHGFGLASGQFFIIVLSVVSIALGTYVVIVSRYEERKLTSVISDAMFFAPSKHEPIEIFLRNLDGDSVRALFQEFTKPELASASLISSADWDSFLHEQRFSWPEFKNRVRIRYALQELNSGYLATKTVESLSLELGFQSRKSFYTAFEAVTGESFRAETYH